MYEFYNQNIQPTVLKRLRKDLRVLYDSIPPTVGCMEHIYTDCGAICCQKQNPQLFFIEFLNSWNVISNNWSKQKIIALLQRAVIQYLNNSVIKGCVFFDCHTKLCMQHSTRPFNCYTYSQVPEEEFESRIKRLKVIYPKEDFLPQCNLTRTIGKKPDKKDMDQWFNELSRLEREFVPSSAINDKEGGSYRTYHDHLLLYLGSDNFLYRLTHIKKSGSIEDAEQIINQIKINAVKFFPKLKWKE